MELNPGETKTVPVSLQDPAFSYWSPEKKDWVMEFGLICRVQAALGAKGYTAQNVDRTEVSFAQN